MTDSCPPCATNAGAVFVAALLLFIILAAGGAALKNSSRGGTWLQNCGALAKEGFQDNFGGIVDGGRVATRSSQNDDEGRAWWHDARYRSIYMKFKIVLGTYQVQNALPWVLPEVDFPASFHSLSSGTAALELDVGRFLPLACLIGPVSFYDRLFLATLVPPSIAGAIMAASVFKYVRAPDGPARTRVKELTSGSLLLLAFVVLPSVATTIFRYWGCAAFERGRADGSTERIHVLLADYGVSCTSRKYKGAGTAYAIFMVFLYPVGIPLAYFVSLWRHRTSINPPLEPLPGETESELQLRKIAARDADPSIRHLRFLYDDYLPRSYQFVVFDCLRKIAQTGLLVFVYSGSGVQIGFGLFLSLVTQQILYRLAPRVDRAGRLLPVRTDFCDVRQEDGRNKSNALKTSSHGCSQSCRDPRL